MFFVGGLRIGIILVGRGRIIKFSDRQANT